MNKTIIGIIAAVIIIGGGYWIYASSQNNAASTGTDMAGMDMNQTGSDTSASGSDTSGTSVGATVGVTAGSAPMSATVNYNGDAFSPSTVTIAKGGTVTFVSTATDMWVASDPHPEHTGYDGTTRQVHCAAGYAGAAPFDECAVGSSYSFTFNKTGSWEYHNHMNPGLGGTVIVQ